MTQPPVATYIPLMMLGWIEEEKDEDEDEPIEPLWQKPFPKWVKQPLDGRELLAIEEVPSEHH